MKKREKCILLVVELILKSISGLFGGKTVPCLCPEMNLPQVTAPHQEQRHSVVEYLHFEQYVILFYSGS